MALSRPRLLSITVHKTLGGSLTIPYPIDLHFDDQVIVAGTVGPNLVTDGADFYGPWPVNLSGGQLIPNSGSAYPYEALAIPTSPVAMTCSWEDFFVADPETTESLLWSRPRGMIGVVGRRRIRVANEPEFSLSTSPGVPLALYMLHVRGGDLIVSPGATPVPGEDRDFPGFFSLFQFSSHPSNPGGTGHAGDYPFSAGLNGFFQGAAGSGSGTPLHVLLTSTALYATRPAASYPWPYFPDVTWSAPAFDPGNLPDPANDYAGIIPAVADDNGNGAWVIESQVGDEDVVQDSFSVISTVTVPNAPGRSDRYWTYSGGAFFQYLIDQSYMAVALSLPFEITEVECAPHPRVTATAPSARLSPLRVRTDDDVVTMRVGQSAGTVAVLAGRSLCAPSPQASAGQPVGGPLRIRSRR